MQQPREHDLFRNRLALWSGLGNSIHETQNVSEALQSAQLSWQVAASPLYANGSRVEGYQANIRVNDGKVLGITTDRYNIIQNHEAFRFLDDLLSEGLEFVSGGSYQDGQRVWILGKMPQLYSLGGDETETYLLFLNSHDGSSSFKVALTPLRILCQNAITLGLKRADRVWSFMHTRTVKQRLQTAIATLVQTENYMVSLKHEIDELQRIRLSDTKTERYIRLLLPIPEEASNLQIQNVERLRVDLLTRYYDAPDLQGMSKDGWRFVNSVSDYVTHAEPLRKTERYRENQFMKTINGNSLADKAVKLLKSAA